MHRVVTNTEREQVSVAMFYQLDSEMEMEPAAELVDERRPRGVREDLERDVRERDSSHRHREALKV